MASGRLVDYLGGGVIADRPASLSLTTGAIGLWFATDTNALSVWDGSSWNAAGGGSGAVWGGITGTLSDQTDLATALAAVVQSVTGTAVDNTDPQNPVINSTGGGGASADEIAVMTRKCALLDPDAIEGLQRDTFSYSVASGVTKYILASWKTTLGATGRTEVRDPARPMAVRNTTVTGLASGSSAVILDPALVTYSDAVSTYYARRKLLDELDTKTIYIVGASSTAPLLPGPYGAIVTQSTCFDLAWVVWRIGSYGLNLSNEISDSSTQRVGHGLRLPVSKQVAGYIENSATASGSAGAGTQSVGSVSYVLLPSSWSAQADPVSSSYTFRDDFMGSSLDAGVWTSAASTAGNVGIDTNYQWCKVFGSGGWSGNALYRTASETRAEGTAMVVDAFLPTDASAGWGGVGWANGGTISGSYSVTNFAHAINFGGSGTLGVFEDGTNRGTVGSGWTAGFAYRVKITLHADGSAKYEIQGGPQYPRIGSASWTDVTPATSASTHNTIYPGAVAYSGHGYISDVRVF